MNWRDAAQTREDPLFDFTWDINIISPAGEFRPEYVESCQLPMPSLDSDSVVLQARRWYYAKFEDFGVLTLKFYEGQSCPIVTALRAWQLKVKTKRGDYVVPSAYKGSMTVMITDPMGAVVQNFKVLGVFPTRVPPIPLGSTGERISHEVEFSLDEVELA